MPTSVDNGVERRVKPEHIHHHTSRPLKVKKMDPSSAAKKHHHKVSRSSKPPQPPRRKDNVKDRESLTEEQSRAGKPSAPEGEAKVASTVVNVDMVREKEEEEEDEEQHEELLGLLESGCQDESKCALSSSVVGVSRNWKKH